MYVINASTNIALHAFKMKTAGKQRLAGIPRIDSNPFWNVADANGPTTIPNCAAADTRLNPSVV
jgi:hypothetical protein